MGAQGFENSITFISDKHLGPNPETTAVLIEGDRLRPTYAYGHILVAASEIVQPVGFLLFDSDSLTP